MAAIYTRLHDALIEHLDAEEQHVMPLVESCITKKEWAKIGKAASAARRARTRRGCSECSSTTATPR